MRFLKELNQFDDDQSNNSEHEEPEDYMQER
jgi:hypothetical protein